ncbi:MAG: winged helix-turn-helix domain-containing protein [Candidatus Bathyarchaeota archaeon]|nr:winged helix-turn-helix domain-containing protein [Candidatus Bathyarchaeota archaeon]
MYRSRLEIYEEILSALACMPQGIENLAFSCSMNCVNLKGYLRFLLQNGAVQQRAINNKNFYALTHRGNAILAQLNQAKHLQKLQDKPKPHSRQAIH